MRQIGLGQLMEDNIVSNDWDRGYLSMGKEHAFGKVWLAVNLYKPTFYSF